jgi:hypothetical protein
LAGGVELLRVTALLAPATEGAWLGAGEPPTAAAFTVVSSMALSYAALFTTASSAAILFAASC